MEYYIIGWFVVYLVITTICLVISNKHIETAAIGILLIVIVSAFAVPRYMKTYAELHYLYTDDVKMYMELMQQGMLAFSLAAVGALISTAFSNYAKKTEPLMTPDEEAKFMDKIRAEVVKALAENEAKKKPEIVAASDKNQS